MLYVPAFLIGMLVSWLIWRRERSELLSDKQRLLDFCEHQQRLIEGLEDYETQLSLRLFYAEHPELKEDQILEAEFVSE
jgi:hypothetical protein